MVHVLRFALGGQCGVSDRMVSEDVRTSHLAHTHGGKVLLTVRLLIDQVTHHERKTVKDGVRWAGGQELQNKIATCLTDSIHKWSEVMKTTKHLKHH